MDFAISKISLDQVVQYIQRDPFSWEGISLFYVCPQDEREEQLIQAALEQSAIENSNVLLFEDQNQYILLGAENVPKLDDAILHRCLWAKDIASERQSVCDVLSKIVATRPVENKKLPPYSILVVEDEPLLNKMMTRYLEQFGTVIATSNYREAIANYTVQAPHLVFLDINYHGDDMNGLDVLKNLLTYDANAFIIMVSGDGRIETRLQAFALGAQGFIVKPFRTIDFSHYLTLRGLET